MIVEVNERFGINLNVIPLAIAAVADTSSPINTGTEPTSDVTPSPIISPAFLLDNITVNPKLLFPPPDVVGDNATSPLLWVTGILTGPNSTRGILVVFFGSVTNLYFITCVSSGLASKTGIFLIATS